MVCQIPIDYVAPESRIHMSAQDMPYDYSWDLTLILPAGCTISEWTGEGFQFQLPPKVGDAFCGTCYRLKGFSQGHTQFVTVVNALGENPLLGLCAPDTHTVWEHLLDEN
jgi:hypothetical protein